MILLASCPIFTVSVLKAGVCQSHRIFNPRLPHAVFGARPTSHAKIQQIFQFSSKQKQNTGFRRCTPQTLPNVFLICGRRVFTAGALARWRHLFRKRKIPFCKPQLSVFQSNLKSNTQIKFLTYGNLHIRPYVFGAKIVL